MRVLYIGGTGEISYSCVHASVAAGQQVGVFNRGINDEPLPPGVTRITGDLKDEAAYRALGEAKFDVVCQFKAYDLPQIERDIDVFGGKCGQYVFISSASAYQKPPASHVITEATPLVNPYWAYSRAKAAMEQRLMRAHEEGALRVTNIRPSHTYRRNFPGTMASGDVTAYRMLNNQPIIVHGDGASLWVVTHADDFAVPFSRLLGHPRALGEAFHITSDQAWNWNQIMMAIGEALGVEPRLVHVSSDTLIRYNPDWSGPLLGDKANSVWFDNTKVKSVAGDFACPTTMPQGMKRVAREHFAARRDRISPDARAMALLDRIAAEQLAIGTVVA